METTARKNLPLWAFVADRKSKTLGEPQGAFKGLYSPQDGADDLSALWYFAWSSQNQPRMARIHAKKIKNQYNLCAVWAGSAH
ncbi:MAG: hypothetical protein U9R05_08910 [Chloroflexota bacterium]|nr:hypothetical protein [Chloroflexota bacterium]